MYRDGGRTEVITGTTFAGANLYQANFRNRTLDNDNFNGARLNGANIGVDGGQTATMTGATFVNAQISNLDMTNRDLTNVNMTGATGTPGLWGTITWSNVTCPDGTNSNSNGNTCAGHFLP